MFDFGFSKLLILGIVALVVVGPERLPRVARTLGHLYGRLQRYVVQVKADIHREMEAADLGNMKNEIESAARVFQSQVEAGAQDLGQQVHEAQASIERSLDDPARSESGPAQAAQPQPQREAEPVGSPQLELGIEDPTQPASRDRASG